MERIYNLLVSILGESKQGFYDKDTTQYQFNCAFCADEKGEVDGKYNLEVSLSLGKFHCWSCGEAGKLSKLIGKRGGKILRNEYFRLLDDIKESSYYKLDIFNDTLAEEEKKYLRLPKTFTKINLSTCRDKQLVDYLNKRKISQDIIDYYNIGHTTWDEEDWTWRNRIIFPSYNTDGYLNFYIGRSYRENDHRAKYQNVKADKYQIVLHEDKIQWDADIYLVEGAIDCIYYPNSISMMGKALRKDTALYNQLQSKARANVVICLDNDTTTEEIARIYKTLNQGNLYNRVKYIVLPDDDNHKDFGCIYEYGGKEELIKTLSDIHEFTESELVRLI